MSKAARLFVWACLVALAVLSLFPPQAMIRTGLGAKLEHLVAYAGTALAVGLAYGGSLRLFVLLALYGGLLEFLQRFSPGRVSHVVDFAFSSAGVLIGAAAFTAFTKLKR